MRFSEILQLDSLENLNYPSIIKGMQEHVSQEPAEVRLTEQEASLMVALHAEREQKDGATTLRDLAETLRISSEDAERLLAEVRSRSGMPVASSEPEAGQEIERVAKSRRGSRSIWGRVAWALSLGAVLFLVAIFAIRLSFANDAEPQIVSSGTAAAPVSAAAARPAAPRSDNLPFHTNHVLTFTPGTVSEFAVAVELGDSTVYTMPTADADSSWLSSHKTDVQGRLEQGIFECLDYARTNLPRKPWNLFSFAVRSPSGGWATFDLPIKSHSGTLNDWMNSVEARNTLKDQILAALREHWAEYGDPNK